MTSTLRIARKELEAAFRSPVALLFLTVFLIATLFWFFTGSRFFARNIADVRPLFESMPVLLIFLVSAVTMRMWADERRQGTLEVLMTLPLRTSELVIGKFFAATALVFLALLFTLPIPWTVSNLGDLDWGPVAGGYVGALLLGALYAALGLLVSSRTDNQVVALITTLSIGAVLYGLGTDAVASMAPEPLAPILDRVATGARFESVARGVLDLRDLVYYGTVTAALLVLTATLFERDRLDPGSTRGRSRVLYLGALGALVLANAVATNVWFEPLTGLRADLTENGEYSLSEVTKDELRSLDEPLVIEAYFSERTHPLLAPLAPQARDLLAEYEIAGRGNVRVEFADPNDDEALQERLVQDYGIRSVPIPVADRTQQSVVNAYFHIVIRYGNQSEVLSLEDLIEVHTGGDELEVRLRNLEYDVTRSIRRVSSDFQTLDAILAGREAPIEMTLYLSPDTLPESEQEALAAIRSVAEELAAEHDAIMFEELDPLGDAERMDELLRLYAIRPMATDLFSDERYYFDLLVRSGEHVERILPGGDIAEADVRATVEAAIRRMTPGQLTTVGLLTEVPEAPPQNPQLPPQFQPPAPQRDFQRLERALSADYQLEVVDASTGRIPSHLDVLIVGKPGELSDEELFAIDQYLMSGGAVIALAGRQSIQPGRRGLDASSTDTGLFDLLASYGVSVDDTLVLDPQAARFPIPVIEERGGIRLQRIEMRPYPFFPVIRPEQFAEGHPATAGLPNVTVPWGSPIRVDASEAVEVTELLRTTEDAWTQASDRVNPDYDAHPELGFASAVTDEQEHTLAVLLQGRLPSHFADRASPFFDPEDAEGSGERVDDGTGRTITESVPDARLAVVGSTEMVSDLLFVIANEQPGGEAHAANVDFIRNLIGWSVEDDDLLEIRRAGGFARTLAPLDEKEQRRHEWTTGGIMLGLLVLLSALIHARRRQTRSWAMAHAQEG